MKVASPKNFGRAFLIQSNALGLPLADKSVHHCTTSPPYWALRSYLPAESPLKALELGSEPTPAAFVANLVSVFREVRRVLRDDGSLFVNIGDSYANVGKWGGDTGGKHVAGLHGSTGVGRDKRDYGDAKGLDRVGIPEQFALAMRADGWFWRDTIIWSKPSPMPLPLGGWRWEKHRVKVKASDRAAAAHKHANGKPHGARDGKEFASSADFIDCPGCKKCLPNGGLILRKGAWRTTTAHEYIFHFTKTESYYGDREAVATPAKAATVSRDRYTRIIDDPDEQFSVRHDHESTGATANLRSVWSIPAEPMKAKHYATFPSRLPELCILATTSEHGVCPTCGDPWARVVNRETMQIDRSDRNEGAGIRTGTSGNMVSPPTCFTTGWRPTCKCPIANPVPAVVLDPFGGSGRTAKAAIRNGRDAISCDLDPANVPIARAEVAKAFAQKKTKRARANRVPVVADLFTHVA